MSCINLRLLSSKFSILLVWFSKTGGSVQNILILLECVNTIFFLSEDRHPYSFSLVNMKILVRSYVSYKKKGQNSINQAKFELILDVATDPIVNPFCVWYLMISSSFYFNLIPHCQFVSTNSLIRFLVLSSYVRMAL